MRRRLGVLLLSATGDDLPVEVGQKRVYDIPPDRTRLVVGAASQGGYEASIVYSDGKQVWVRSSDGGVRAVLQGKELPDELALAEGAEGRDSAMVRHGQPYSELVYEHGDVMTSLSETIWAVVSPKLAWLPDGKEFLIADSQGLSGCSDQPVVVTCPTATCSSRCLNAINAGSAVSVRGGIVIVAVGPDLSVFSLTSATFDGGRSLAPDRMLRLDAGAAEFLVVAPDGQRAAVVTRYPNQRILLFSPQSEGAEVVANLGSPCSVFGLLASNEHAVVLCESTEGGAVSKRLVLVRWSGEVGPTVELADDDQQRTIAPHLNHILRLTPRDGGVELERIF